MEELLARSDRLGADPRNTNYAGGNTSAKGTGLDPVTGEPVELLWSRVPVETSVPCPRPDWRSSGWTGRGRSPAASPERRPGVPWSGPPPRSPRDGFGETC